MHFELIPTSTSRDELGKPSGQHGQGRVKSTGKIDLGLIEIKLQLLTPRRTYQLGIVFPTAFIIGIIKVLYMHCLNLKLHSPKLEKCRLYRTKRSINYNDALRPYIVWGALCGYLMWCLKKKCHRKDFKIKIIRTKFLPGLNQTN